MTGIVNSTNARSGIIGAGVIGALVTGGAGLTGSTSLGTVATGTWEGTDVAVAHGGTGASTLTANYALLGNGTSAPQMIAPSTSGNVLTSNGSTWASTAVAGGGVILQVLSAFKDDTYSTSSTTVALITGLTVDITPASSSNKILILGSLSFSKANTNSGFVLNLFCDEAEIGMGDNTGFTSRPEGIADLNQAATAVTFLDHRHVHFLHSPSTTSEITYEFRIGSRDSTGIYINTPSSTNNVVYNSVCSSSITVMEVKG